MKVEHNTAIAETKCERFRQKVIARKMWAREKKKYGNIKSNQIEQREKKEHHKNTHTHLQIHIHARVTHVNRMVCTYKT